MSNTDLIKELRALTQAGMKDCKSALEEANWDLEKAVDIIKVKGQNIVSGREGKVASEGIVGILNTEHATPVQIMAEVNCQTDFVAKSAGFTDFVQTVLVGIHKAFQADQMFDVASVEEARSQLVASTKENVVVRRWWVEQGLAKHTLVFPYLHSNNKIGVLLTLTTSSFEISNSPEFIELGNDLAMQVAAMNPLVVSQDRLPQDVLARQKTIFENQLTELKKPPAAWPKILDGKFNKWHTDVCLLNQESVVSPKTTIKQVIEKVSAKLGGEITVANFIRCQVGEGIEKTESNFAQEVANLTQG